MNKLIILSLLFPLSLFSMERINNLMVPHHVGNVGLYHNEDGFHIEQEGNYHRVHNYDVDPVLRKVTPKQLAAFQQAGFIKINKMDNGEFTLRAHTRGPGGTGPITANVVGFGVRFFCYTGYLLGVTTPVVVGSLVAGPGGATAGGAAAGLVVANAGGAAGVIAATETLAMKATLATLLWPIPLP